ncbi:acyltransferase family protein [Streptomyces zingiberis]|uniref:Acyltransferase family protein n=1 Tax=Streptomyces zingiberis TaxID=2053010 RepID=A0ABX1BUX9_9ACTN|nr:acyltransferase family protein [Streptomyces zingiberis]NJQ00350.1 acyltransferase family protein [Streptomyces zingiberis]
MSGAPPAPAEQRRGTGGDGPAAAAPRAAAARDPFFDNAKLLAMVLVVVGHAWQPLKDSRAVWAAYFFLYTFHMPVFILLSGYFSRTFRGTGRQMRRLVAGVLVPYAVFETVYTLYGNAVDDRGNDISLLTPWYLTWFLIALFVWRLTAPLWLVLRPSLALGLSLALALLATAFDAGPVLNLDRVLQFLPFFVLGLLMRPDHWELVRTRAVRIAAIPLAAAGLATAYWARDHTTSEWAVRAKTWEQLGVDWPAGLVTSLALLVCSLALCAAFLAWVPRGNHWFTAFGAGTLVAYLLHGLIIRTAAWEGWYEPRFWHTPAGQLVVTVLGVGLALLLTSPPVRRLLRPVVEPRLDRLFPERRPAAETGPAREEPGGEGGNAAGEGAGDGAGDAARAAAPGPPGTAGEHPPDPPEAAPAVPGEPGRPSGGHRADREDTAALRRGEG